MSIARLNNMVRITLPQECVAEQFDRDHTRYYTLYVDERWLRDQIIALDQAKQANENVVEKTVTETVGQTSRTVETKETKETADATGSDVNRDAEGAPATDSDVEQASSGNAGN